MDELRLRLKASTDALEAAEVPMSAGYAEPALRGPHRLESDEQVQNRWTGEPADVARIPA